MADAEAALHNGPEDISNRGGTSDADAKESTLEPPNPPQPTGEDWMEIKMDEKSENVSINGEGGAETQYSATPLGDAGEGIEPTSSEHNMPDTPTISVQPSGEQVDESGRPFPPQRKSSHNAPTASTTNGHSTLPLQSRSRSASQSTTATAYTARTQGSTLSSMVFVVTALEHIAASKEARKRKPLSDSVQKALQTIKELDPQLPDPEIIFEPLRLASTSANIQVATTALDCIGKLISYSYFSIPTNPNYKPSKPEEEDHPLIERAIDTICESFQGEATPVEIQLQIIKSLLSAVLDDKIVVHGAGLLKAVRLTYNIFLLSKSSPNQQVAQITLTQMVNTVFERVKVRVAMKEARLGLSRLGISGQSVTTLDATSSAVVEQEETVVEPSVDGTEETASVATTDVPVSKKGSGEKITLQSFENRKSFDDERINDNAPTMVTHNTPQPKSGPVSGQVQHSSDDPDYDEEEEDEIYIKDAFLVFRAMCKLSIKTLPQEQLQDLRSHGMRSKLLSLHIIHIILQGHMDVFLSPLATIRSSGNNEPTGFLHAVKQYLCLSLSRNGSSSVNRVFEVGCEIFWLMLKNMRVMLKVRSCGFPITTKLLTDLGCRKRSRCFSRRYISLFWTSEMPQSLKSSTLWAFWSDSAPIQEPW
jgi:brefeldin A-inhibited guanine nucleotide-exchange protein